VTRPFAASALLSLLLGACSQGGGPEPPPVATGTDGPVAPRPDARPSTAVDAAAPQPDVPPAVPPCTPADSVLCNPLRPLPPTIRETGFFPMPGDLAVLPPNVHPFVPSLQLWSDGLHKQRQIILPRGQKIDNSKRDVWVFPTGTILLKTFLGDGPNGMKPVETRVIRRTDNPDPFEQYTFDVYRWDAAGTAATLIDIQERTPVPVMIAGSSLTHLIPSRDDCKKCHTANVTPIIGFDEIRLNAPGGLAGKTQLESFALSGYFTQAPPSSAAQITDPDPLTQRVKGYLYGNCYHCHNGNDTQAFDMNPQTLVMAVVRQPTMGSGTAPGIRVVPGNPEMSVLYRQLTRMNLTRGYNPMPPVGVQVADPDAVQLVREWILSLR
jgi:hypothetical protein